MGHPHYHSIQLTFHAEPINLRHGHDFLSEGHDRLGTDQKTAPQIIRSQQQEGELWKTRPHLQGRQPHAHCQETI